MCCHWWDVETYNCLVIETEVSMKQEEEEMQSAAGEVVRCHYLDGRRALPTGGYLLWNPMQEEAGRYIPYQNLMGSATKEGNRTVWVVEKKQIALSWKDKAVFDCEHSVIVSEQGFALQIQNQTERRVQRNGDLPSITHLDYKVRSLVASAVTLASLAVQLTSLSMQVTSNVQLTLSHMVLSI